MVILLVTLPSLSIRSPSNDDISGATDQYEQRKTLGISLTPIRGNKLRLISESIERYKGNELFKNVFIPKEEMEASAAEEEWEEKPELESPFEEEPTTSLEREEDIFDLSVDIETPTPEFPREEAIEGEPMTEELEREENQQ